jgi:PST family polysaccharide transporter
MNPVWTKYLPGRIRSKLEGRRNLQKIIGNTFWLFCDRILRMGMGLLVGVWVARYLGPKQFGVLNYACAYVALFSVIVTLGLDNIVVRELVRQPDNAPRILGSVFLLKLAGGALAMVTVIGSIVLTHQKDVQLCWVVGIIAAGVTFQAFDTIDFWFQSQVLSKYTVWAKNSAFLIISAVKVCMIFSGASLIAFAWTGLAEAILGALGLMLAYRASGAALGQWRWSLGICRTLLKDSWPLVFASLSITIYMKIDQVMLGDMVGSEAVGIYSAATKISEVWYFIPSAIATSVFPTLIQAKETSEKLYYQKLRNLFNLMGRLALLIAVPMTFLSTPLVELLFGKGYTSSGPVLSIHIWAALFVFLGVAQGPWDLAENLTKLSMYRTIIGATINVLLNIILIPRYAALGAAIATVVSYAFSAVILNIAHKRTRPIFYYQARSLLLFKGLRDNT